MQLIKDLLDYQRDSLGTVGDAANREIHWFIRDIHWVNWEMLLIRDSHWGMRDSQVTLGMLQMKDSLVYHRYSLDTLEMILMRDSLGYQRSLVYYTTLESTLESTANETFYIFAGVT